MSKYNVWTSFSLIVDDIRMNRILLFIYLMFLFIHLEPIGLVADGTSTGIYSSYNLIERLGPQPSVKSQSLGELKSLCSNASLGIRR